MNVISRYANFETTSYHFIMSTCSCIIVTDFAVPLSKLWQPVSLLFEFAALDLSKFVHPCHKDNSRLGNIVLSTQVRSE